MTITSHVLRVDDLSITHLVHTVTEPNGLPVVLLHGWGASSDLMKPVMERMINAGCSMYAPDLPGFGESEAPRTAWTVFDYAQWVRHYLAAIRVERANLIGHSFGGRLGIILGADDRLLIEKLILADAAGVPPKRPLSGRIRLATYKSVRRLLNAIGAKATADRLAGWYNRRFGSADYQQTSGVMRETFVNVVNEDLRQSASRVRVPTLLIWGDRDEDTPLWQGKTLESLIPDAGLVVFEGAGHYSYLDHLNDFIRITRHFFST